MPTCRFCKQNIKSQDAVFVFDKHYVCSQDCLIKYRKTDDYFRDKLLDTLWSITDKSGNFIKLQRQVEWYRERYDYKYSGMLYTVEYWSNVKNNAWQNQWGIGQIFPDAYSEAMDYWQKMKRLKQLAKSVPKPQTRTIIAKDNSNNKKKFNINIEDL